MKIHTIKKKNFKKQENQQFLQDSPHSKYLMIKIHIFIAGLISNSCLCWIISLTKIILLLKNSFSGVQFPFKLY